MQVPEHVVSLYVATCGQNGQELGSDEKEIILLVYVILEAASSEIIGTKQLLVRPDGRFSKDQLSIEAPTHLAIAPPPPPIASPTDSNINSTNCGYNTALVHTNTNSTTNNANHTLSSSLNGVTVPVTPTEHNNELPIAIAQAAGKPLSDAVEEFDQYLRTLLLNIGADAENIHLITDGQLPLRQSLHREACVKNIMLPAYYNRFCDLRKEFVRYKSGDLSRALVPVKDIKKILQQMPTAPALPQSIAEMMTDLNLTSTEDVEFFMRESRDMVSVIQYLLKAGHKFYANEMVNLVLEPGICSIDDEIDGNCIVRARGLPWQSSDQDIAKFFRGLNVAKGGVALCLSPLGRRNGEALIRFISQEHRDMALKRHKHHIEKRYIEVYRATGEDFLSVAGGASNEAQAFLSKGAQVIIRMRGLPYDCTAKQVLDFFTAGDDPCHVLDATEGVLFVKKPDGRATGDAFVLFATETDAPKALSRHRESIGQRYIELFRSTTAEVQQVLNRSLDPKTYETNQQPPLIAQLPAMPLSLLPQHLITSGTSKNCIRLRGLPYEALVEHILHFLDDFAKHIIYQGVHMVINAQGQPSGEAFIQMDTEESARLCAQRKHNQFMVFGKKYRYIEVFQCSGDDMNLVLNGGLQSPIGTATGLHHPHHHHPHAHTGGGKHPPLLSPGMLTQTPPPNAQTISSSHHRHTLHHPHAHTHALTPAAAAVLQSPTSIAAATVAALTQSAHQPPPLPLAAAATANTAATSPQSAVMASLMSAAAATQGAATLPPQNVAPHATTTALMQQALAAQNVAVATSLPNVHQQASLSFSAPAQLTAQTPTLSFNLPSPQGSSAAAAGIPNSALLAQQQAQFIAQQTLLARQQAAVEQQQQQQQQFYAAANLINPILMQHPAAAAAAVSASQQAMAASAMAPSQFFLMPRPAAYFQHFPFGGYAMPTAPNYPSLSGVGSPAAAMIPSAAGLPSGAMTQPTHSTSMKRSYEHAFHPDVNVSAASAAKRALTRPSPGASVIGGPYVPHFAHFSPHPRGTLLTTTTATAQRNGGQPQPHAVAAAAAAAHHSALAATAAFYQQPVYNVYWPYPSPPVSPTTFFTPPPTHASPTGSVYPLDFLPPNFAVTQSASLTAPNVALSSATGIILSPNKTSALQIVPTTATAKSFSTLPTAPVAINGKTTGTTTATAAKTKNTQQNTNSIAKVTSTGLTNNNNNNNNNNNDNMTTNKKKLTPPLALLTIDTCDQYIKSTKQTSTNTTTGVVNATGPQQVELYIT